MKRLVDHGLIYGGLFRVSTPVMLERYNAALKALTGKTTMLEAFHIDLSGYSPEVGEEFGDRLYLNHDGCNRQFILLSVEQRHCPLIDAYFSTTSSILKQFIEDNYPQLVALCARDAVMGELDNSTWRIDDVEDLVTIRNITVQVDTPRGLIARATELESAIDVFHDDDNAWWDDAVLTRMCALAETVGDIQQHPIVPTTIHYRKRNFHTRHFGGLYVFRDSDEPVIITCDSDFAAQVPDAYRRIELNDADALSAFLHGAGHVENILSVPSLDHRKLLQDRIDFMLIDLLSGLDDGPDFATMRRIDWNRAARWHFGELPQAFQTLSDVLKALDQEEPVRPVEPGDAGHFYLLRAADHPDRDMVNHLLARLTPLDFRQMFICNKEMFYAAYQSWPERKRDYVAQFLAERFLVDRQGEWQRLYAGDAREPDAAETGPPGMNDQDKVIASVDWTGVPL